MLLAYKFLLIMDLETKKTLLVMYTDLSQRNQSETFSNMLTMMEKYLDSLQDSTLRFLKM